jgi:hypothetical protein
LVLLEEKGGEKRKVTSIYHVKMKEYSDMLLLVNHIIQYIYIYMYVLNISIIIRYSAEHFYFLPADVSLPSKYAYVN